MWPLCSFQLLLWWWVFHRPVWGKITCLMKNSPLNNGLVKSCLISIQKSIKLIAHNIHSYHRIQNSMIWLIFNKRGLLKLSSNARLIIFCCCKGDFWVALGINAKVKKYCGFSVFFERCPKSELLGINLK